MLHDGMETMSSLESLGIIAATDKSMLTGDYLHSYEPMFAPLREQEFNFIEIGVYHGASVRMWEQFFTRARIVGVDIDPACQRYASDRVVIETGSQDDPEFLHRVASANPPTIIIDDGSHIAEHIMFTFERLFPALLDGGLYVVEDIHFHTQEPDATRLRGRTERDVCDYFLGLARRRLMNRNTQSLTGWEKLFHTSIDSVSFISQGIVIRKSVRERSSLASLRAVVPLVRESKNGLNWLCLADRLKAAGAMPAEVLEALDAGIALEGSHSFAHERRAENLEQTGDLEGAVAALLTAAGTEARNPSRQADIAAKAQRVRKLIDAARPR